MAAGGFLAGFANALSRPGAGGSQAAEEHHLEDIQAEPMLQKLGDPNLSPGDADTLRMQILKIYGPHKSHRALAKMADRYGINPPTPQQGTPIQTPAMSVGGNEIPAGAPQAVGYQPRTIAEILTQAGSTPDFLARQKATEQRQAAEQMLQFAKEQLGLKPEDMEKLKEHLVGLPIEKPQPENWQPLQAVRPDGTPVSLLRNARDGSITDLAGNAVDPQVLSSLQFAPKTNQAPKVGSFGDFMAAAYGSHPTAQQYEEGRRAWAAANAGVTTGTHVIQVPQPDGSIKMYQVQTSSQKHIPGAPETSSLPSTRQDVPGLPRSTSEEPIQAQGEVLPPEKPRQQKTAAELKSMKPTSTKTAKAPNTNQPKTKGTNKTRGQMINGAVKELGTVGGRMTQPQIKAKEALDTARSAYQDVQRAAADPTPVGDQGVILAWLRGRVNRVTTTEIKQVNNLGGAQMKLEGNIVRLVSGKMTDAQRSWFLQSARNNYEIARDNYQQYEQPQGGNTEQNSDPEIDAIIKALNKGKRK